MTKAMLQPKELRDLSRLSGVRTLTALAMDWVLIAAIWITFSHLDTTWQIIAWPLGALLISRTQLALAVLMHDGAHKRLFKSQAMNEWVGQFGCSAPLFFAMDSYKKLHLKHHLNPLVSDDPDISLTGGYPIPKQSFRRKLLRDLVGISYFKFLGYFIYVNRKGAKARKVQMKSAPAASTAAASTGPSRLWIASSILLVQGAIFAALWTWGHPWYFFTLWFLPLATVLQLLMRVRGITEHAGYQPNENQALNARTVVSPLQTFFFAPHGVNYHIEHHLYPSVPFYHLPELHSILKSRGVLPEKNVYTSYWDVVAELVLPVKRES